MRHLSRLSDERLLTLTRSGDGEAFGAFFARHSEPVVAFVRRRVSSSSLAADVTAEVFAAALIATHRGNATDVADGLPWLLGIARHKVADGYRAEQAQDSACRQLKLERRALSAQDSTAIDRLGLDPSIQAALDELGSAERAAVIERVVLERDYSQIADRTNTTGAAARKRVSRGLARLRKQIGANPP